MSWEIDASTVRVWRGSCLDAMSSLADNSVQAVVTDPPYGLTDFSSDKVVDAIVQWASGNRSFVPEGKGFMGASWDCFVPPPAVWDECLRVLSPGAHMAVFAGSRTVDLMGLSMRLAGFELRDTLAWLRADGMPKGQEVANAMVRRGDVPAEAARWRDWHSALKPSMEPIVLARKPLRGTLVGNVAEHGTGALNVGVCRVGSARRFPSNAIVDERASEELDSQSGILTSGRAKKGGHTRNQPPGEGIFGGGKASRFFYCAKAPKKERPVYTDDSGTKVSHVSVKPLSLMRWLTNLVSPPGAVVLDPFAGSGTTLEAALLNGFSAIGCEEHEPYIGLIEQRLSRVQVS